MLIPCAARDAVCPVLSLKKAYFCLRELLILAPGNSYWEIVD